MINPQTINPLTLPSVTLNERSQLPATSGIYFAIDSNEIVQYIGQSTSIKGRWINHHKCKHLQSLGKINIAYLECPRELLLDIEIALIEWFNPPLNRCRKESDTSFLKCKLRDYMEEQDLTQQEVAARTGLSPTIIGRLYHNRFSRLDNQTVIKVCKLFNASLGEMFFIDESA